LVGADLPETEKNVAGVAFGNKRDSDAGFEIEIYKTSKPGRNRE
jgi:hypothetical protein